MIILNAIAMQQIIEITELSFVVSFMTIELEKGS